MFSLIKIRSEFKQRIRNKEKLRASKAASKELRAYIKSYNERENDLRKREEKLSEREKQIDNKIDYIDSLIIESRELQHRIETIFAMMARAFQTSQSSRDHLEEIKKNVKSIKRAT